MRRLPLAPLGLLPLLLACEAGPAVTEPPAWCEGGTVYDYEPDRVDSFTTYPDDHWTLPAPTLTGRRVHLEVEQTPALEAQSVMGDFLAVYDELSLQDGWGTSAGVVFRFRRTVDPASIRDGTAAFVAFTPAGPRRIGADAVVTDFGSTVILRPRVALPSATEVAAALFTEARGADGACVAPSAYLRELLSPETELPPGFRPSAFSERFRAAARALGRGPTEIAAMTVYTTQSAAEVGRRAAEDIADRDAPEAVGPFACAYESENDRTVCDGRLRVGNYLAEDRRLPEAEDPAVRSVYDLPVRAWLPGTGAGGPWPTVLYGHGLGGSRSQGRLVADLMTPEGVAVLSVDAVEHQDHPLRSEPPIEAFQPLTIFGIDLDPPRVSGRLIRDNLRQSAFDKLQTLRAVEEGLDVTGDGEPDFDVDRLAYVGASLGGIMGPQLLASTDRFRAAVLTVPAGRVTSILRGSELLGPLVALMRPPDATDGDIERFFPLLQAVVDAGDPLSFASAVVQDRWDDAAGPSLLVQIARHDEVIPNAESEALGRSLSLPGVGREVWAVPEVEFEPGPLRGNLPGGASGGIQLFDAVRPLRRPDAEPEPAAHRNTPLSFEAWEGDRALLLPILEGGIGAAIDPYAG